jgi:hypothetical protein
MRSSVQAKVFENRKTELKIVNNIVFIIGYMKISLKKSLDPSLLIPININFLLIKRDATLMPVFIVCNVVKFQVKKITNS